MELLMMSDIFDEYKYDESFTTTSPITASGALEFYNDIVNREGGKTQIKNVSVINMDMIKDSLEITPTPSSMDIAFIISKTAKYQNNTKTAKMYILVDFKFNVTAVDKVCANISDKSIKEKFTFSCNYIRSNDCNTCCANVAYFVFNNKNFEQIKNRWSQRHLRSPKNVAIKQSDFEKLFS